MYCILYIPFLDIITVRFHKNKTLEVKKHGTRPETNSKRLWEEAIPNEK